MVVEEDDTKITTSLEQVVEVFLDQVDCVQKLEARIEVEEWVAEAFEQE